MVASQEAQATQAWRRHPEARRQCGRCGGRRGLRARRDAAAGRQYRRRRLHARSYRQERRDVAIDYRETAPKAASRDMFLDAKGEPDPQRSRYSGSRWRARHGARPRARAGAIRLGQVHPRRAHCAGRTIGARRHSVEDDLADTLPGAAGRLGRDAATPPCFLERRQAASRAASVSCRPTSRRRSRRSPSEGPDAFYRRGDRGASSPRDAPTRRRHDARRTSPTIGRRARAGDRHVSRLRDRLDAAAKLRRRAPRRRFSTCSKASI